MSSDKTLASCLHTNDRAAISKFIFRDKVRLLYEQLPLGILAETIIFSILVIALFSQMRETHFLIWVFYMLAILALWSTLWCLHSWKKSPGQDNYWLYAFAVFAFCSGLGWGLMVSLLMPENNLHQAFIMILIIGLTAGTIPLFSPLFFIYALFLFSVLGPFIFWLFSKGDIYSLLGYCALIYVAIVLTSCYYANKFLTTALALRYKNLNLDNINQYLENIIEERTSELTKSLAITKATLEATADGILVVDVNGHPEYYNHRFLDLWNLILPDKPLKNLKSSFSKILQRVIEPEAFLRQVAHLSVQLEAEESNEIALKTGQIFEWHAKPYRIGNRIVGRVWSFHDITKRKQMEEQLAYQAHHDLLTGLPNRKLFHDRLIHAINVAKRQHDKLILLFLDIDDFKLINDNFGHPAGDTLLEQTARRLRQCARASDTVARFGGDEFVLLFSTKDYAEAHLLCERVLSAMNKPIRLAHQEIVVTANIGISLYPRDGNDAATLLKNADMAMYYAKNLGRNNYHLYDESIRQMTQISLEMQIQLRNALSNSEFFLVYQPTINLQTGQLVGLEALLRWRHPERGIVYPDEFIKAAEHSGLIIPLGQWVFAEACKQNRIWQEQYRQIIPIAINVSGVQFRQEDFIEFIDSCLIKYGLSAESIEIELTESVIMNEQQENMHILQELSKKGIRLAIDDFGTGYSSLSYLRDFPVTKLKIAQVFVKNCPHEPHNASIVSAIIAMAHGLEMRVLAEGIENSEQLAFLKKLDCDEGQGYLFNEPLEAGQFTRFFEGSLSPRTD